MKKSLILLTALFIIGCQTPEEMTYYQYQDFKIVYGKVIDKKVITDSDNKVNYFVYIRVDKIVKYEKDEKGNKNKTTTICTDPPHIMEVDKKLYDSIPIGKIYTVKTWFN